jgi:alpha-galactosidase
MGFNSWYAIHKNLINYVWRPGYCASDDVMNIAQFFVDNGLLDLGYNRMNFDDCIVVGRDANGNLIPDPAAFPYGVLNVSKRFAALGFSMGWYTVRGDTTCASGGPPRIERPGSAGHEDQDAAFYVANGINYLKDDTCGGPQTSYTVMRDALNKTGVPVFFSMCEPGSGPQTAPVGRQWGNAWRVDIDDGGLWRPILQNINTNAGLYNYSGCDEQHNNDGYGCGWNDMGLLMVGGGM